MNKMYPINTTDPEPGSYYDGFVNWYGDSPTGWIDFSPTGRIGGPQKPRLEHSSPLVPGCALLNKVPQPTCGPKPARKICALMQPDAIIGLPTNKPVPVPQVTVEPITYTVTNRTAANINISGLQLAPNESRRVQLLTLLMIAAKDQGIICITSNECSKPIPCLNRT